MPNIVIVDDRVTNRNILSRLATSLNDGVSVHSFSDPAEALAWVQHHTPDLVITDFKMPKMDGSEFIRHFRRQAACLDVPVIVVTVYEDRDFRYRALEAGATDFLLSPVDHHEFVTRAQNLLTMRRQQEIIKRRAYSLEQRLLEATSQHREELRNSQRMLALVIDTLPAMVSASDLEGRCVFANSYQTAFFETDQEGVVGRSLGQAFGQAYGQRHRELDRQVIAGGRPIAGIEEVLLDPDGGRHVFLTTKAPLRDGAGRVANVVTVSLEITERTRIEQALRRSKEEAERANLAKSRFLAHMSHELRTPLNAIIGFADLLRTELYGPLGAARYREYARDIHASGQNLLTLIDNILDTARIEAGQFHLNEQANDLPQVVRDVLADLDERIGLARVTVAVRLDPELPPLRADPTALHEILMNLLGNAIRFTEPGGSVVLSGRLAMTGGIELTITDTGIGIESNRLALVVQRFEAIGDPFSQAQNGTGLGLPLSADLMALHGGALAIDSRPGEGTRITLTFPAERSLPARVTG